jgi:hypothetical protein
MCSSSRVFRSRKLSVVRVTLNAFFRGLIVVVNNVIESPLFAMAYTDILAAKAAIAEGYDPHISGTHIILQSVFKDFLRTAGFCRIDLSQ